MSSNSKFYCISWVLKPEFDPDQEIHYGPPLFLRKQTIASGDLILSPCSFNFAKRRAEKFDKLAKRGTHSVVELTSLTPEMLADVKKVYGNFKRIEMKGA